MLNHSLQDHYQTSGYIFYKFPGLKSMFFKQGYCFIRHHAERTTRTSNISIRCESANALATSPIRCKPDLSTLLHSS